MRREWATTRKAIGFAVGAAALLALTGCGAAAESATTATTETSAPALPTASTSSSAVGAEEAAPDGYRFVEAPMLGLTLAIPEDMSILASGSDLTTMTDEQLQSEADAEGKTVEEFHARWDNVDLVAYANDVSDGVISVELTLAPTLTELPTAETLLKAAESSGLEGAKTFEVDTLYGTGIGFQATKPAEGDAAEWQMASIYSQNTEGTVFSLTLYTSTEDAMATSMPIILASMASVG